MGRHIPAVRKLASLGLVILAAPLSAADLPREPPAATATAPEEKAAPCALYADAVHGKRIARRVFYTWTTKEQIAELRTRTPLLSRSESPIKGPSFFDLTMKSQAEAGDKVAKLLRQPEFLRARFAWTNPWATLLGWPGETYGDQLLRVVLREEAWLAIYSRQDKTFRLVDMKGQPVTEAAVLREPKRLGAVYFLQDNKWVDSTMGSFVNHGGGGAPYREFVLCNEAMIASFEAGTPAVREELRRSISVLSMLNRELSNAPGKWKQPPYREWAGQQPARWGKEVPPRHLLEAYELSLAFPNTSYHAPPAQLPELLTALENALAAMPAPLSRP